MSQTDWCGCQGGQEHSTWQPRIWTLLRLLDLTRLDWQLHRLYGAYIELVVISTFFQHSLFYEIEIIRIVTRDQLW